MGGRASFQSYLSPGLTLICRFTIATTVQFQSYLSPGLTQGDTENI